MASDTWIRCKRLLDEASRIAPAERQDFLLRACGDDGDLLEEVRSLLEALEAAGDFLSRPVASPIAEVGMTAPSAPDRGPAQVGERFGAYALRQELGLGGMGSVYRAVRVDEAFEHEVAVKVLRRGLDSDEILGRFRRERQILADLKHPNIAQLIDGGSNAFGRPYLVMELVEGEPVDSYCDRRRLTITERLVLFRKICSAVQFAHQNLVVHRDLKPSNILITEAGEPKLLDFGIAKVLHPEGFPRTIAATAPGVSPMTPAFASPEQVAAGPITTASDVYSLGVVLYRLLTGRHPYRLSGSRHEIEEAVCRQEPERPSTMVIKPNGEGTEIAAETGVAQVSNLRGTEPQRLRRLLRGDLDTIVLVALRKEPERRYPSVEQLAGDIDRYLTSRPLLARPDTFVYRSHKFIRRHRLPVSIAAIAMLLLLTAFVALLVQTRRVLAQRDRAEAVSDLVLDVFSIPDPTRARGETITALEVLNRSAERIDLQLRTQPEVKADLLDTMGRSFKNLGLYGEARRLSTRALELRRSVFGRRHPEVASSLQLLAEIEMLDGSYEAAAEQGLAALEMRRSIHGGRHLDVAESLYRLARIKELQGDFVAADNRFRQALGIARRGGDPDLLASVLDRFAILETSRGHLSSAESLFTEALELRTEPGGDLHPEAALTQNNLAILYSRRGEQARAERLLREVEAEQRRLFGDDHAYLATTLANLAWVLKEQGEYAQAGEIFEQAAEIQREVYGGDHPRLALTWSNLAEVRSLRGELESAEALFRQAMASQRELIGEHHPDYAATLNNLARLLVNRGRLDEAEPFFLEALDINRSVLGPRHSQVGIVLNNLAQVRLVRGDSAGASELYREALAIHREALGTEHPEVAITLHNLARIRQGEGDLEGARAMLGEALDIARSALDPEHPDLARLSASLAHIEHSLGHYDEAAALAKNALEFLESAPAGDIWLRFASDLYIVSLSESKRFDEAESYLLSLLEANDEEDSEVGAAGDAKAQLVEDLIELYEKSGQPAEADRLRASMPD